VSNARTEGFNRIIKQVKLGWKEFGWGHGSVWSGVAEPVDAIGLDEGGPEAGDLQLRVDLPEAATRGEFVSATVTVTNVGNAPRDVTTALNLADSGLQCGCLASHRNSAERLLVSREMRQCSHASTFFVGQCHRNPLKDDAGGLCTSHWLGSSGIHPKFIGLC
jgi:hypothetical protein